MKEGLHPVREVYLDFGRDDPGFDERGEEKNWFVIHTHIGSCFDRRISKTYPRKEFRLEGKRLKHFGGNHYAPGHEVVNGKPGENQAEDILCRLA